MKIFNLFKKKQPTIELLNNKYEAVCSLFDDGELSEVWIDLKSDHSNYIKQVVYKTALLEDGIQWAVNAHKPIYVLTYIPRNEELIMLDYFLNLGGDLVYFDGKNER